MSSRRRIHTEPEPTRGRSTSTEPAPSVPAVPKFAAKPKIKRVRIRVIRKDGTIEEIENG